MATAKTPLKTPRTKAVAPPAKPAAKRVAPARPRAAAVTAAPTAAADGVEHHEKPRIKLVRDSFTMPQLDFDLIPALKKRALAFQRPAKKSELLRAGLHALAALDNARLKKALDSLAPIRAGRPKKAG